MAAYLIVSGMKLGFMADQSYTVNDRPATVKQIGDIVEVSYVFFRAKRPKRTSGARKRRLALKAATKKYRFSIKLRREA